MAYQKCPCCDGWGKRKRRKWLFFFEVVRCDSCFGRGIVGFADTAPVEIVSPFFGDPVVGCDVGCNPSDNICFQLAGDDAETCWGYKMDARGGNGLDLRRVH